MWKEAGSPAGNGLRSTPTPPEAARGAQQTSSRPVHDETHPYIYRSDRPVSPQTLLFEIGPLGAPAAVSTLLDGFSIFLARRKDNRWGHLFLTDHSSEKVLSKKNISSAIRKTAKNRRFCRLLLEGGSQGQNQGVLTILLNISHVLTPISSL